jgi:hypothetical protein
VARNPPNSSPQRRPDPLVSLSLDDLMTPGVMVEVDPDVAGELGAFEETALSEDDAWDANADREESDDGD